MKQGNDYIRRVVSCIILMLIVGCIFSLLLILVFPSLDRQICYSKAAQRIGGRPIYSELVRYVESSLVPGMTEDETLEELKFIAPSVKATTQDLPDNTIRNTYIIHMCWFPLNNIVVNVEFNQDGKLVSTFIEKDSP